MKSEQGEGVDCRQSGNEIVDEEGRDGWMVEDGMEIVIARRFCH